MIALMNQIWETSRNKLKKHSVNKKLFWPFTVWTNYSSDLKNFANSQPSVSNFKSFSRSLEQFSLIVGQNNFGNKIPFPMTSLTATGDLAMKWCQEWHENFKTKFSGLKYRGYPRCITDLSKPRSAKGISSLELNKAE